MAILAFSFLGVVPLATVPATAATHKTCVQMKYEMLRTRSNFRAIATTGGAAIEDPNTHCGLAGRLTPTDAKTYAMLFCTRSAKFNHDSRPCQIVYFNQRP